AAGRAREVILDGSADVDRMMRIRPYALTGGRTRPTIDLPLETLVRTNDRGRSVRHEVGTEERRILDLAGSPISVAEISAHLGVVLGVARVLVGDLVVAGRLDRSTTPAELALPSSDVSLLERVLDGLKAL
ncbi:DUF742 domain-containing protein, partial [Bradyrhizobium sp. NBAIM08]|uniref:DUF742 domain-containing protein n=1 Tax=Bradyrhizobium sp. NBAIM08 TaxID=2793815 RepID=UPI001CD36C54